MVCGNVVTEVYCEENMEEGGGGCCRVTITQPGHTQNRGGAT